MHFHNNEASSTFTLNQNKMKLTLTPASTTTTTITANAIKNHINCFLKNFQLLFQRQKKNLLLQIFTKNVF